MCKNEFIIFMKKFHVAEWQDKFEKQSIIKVGIL